MNQVNLIGRITKPLELHKTQSGASVLKFTLAINTTKEKTDFINCVAWEKAAELIEMYCDKGSRLGVTGRLSSGSFVNKEGKNVYTTDVVVEKFYFLESAKQQGQVNDDYQQDPPQEERTLDLLPEDLPF